MSLGEQFLVGNKTDPSSSNIKSLQLNKVNVSFHIEFKFQIGFAFFLKMHFQEEAENNPRPSHSKIC